MLDAIDRRLLKSPVIRRALAARVDVVLQRLVLKGVSAKISRNSRRKRQR